MRLTAFLCDFKKVGELTKKYSNLPDSYIKRSMEQIYYKTPRVAGYRRREKGKKRINFTEHRPWTMESRRENGLFERVKTIYLEPISEWSIFKGDRVEILVGKDKGKHGIVSQVIQERNWVIVEGLNCQLRYIRKSGVPVGVLQEEKPLRVTDQVGLVDPSDMLPCKVEWRFTEKGEKVRISKRSGRIIPMSRMANETYDYKVVSGYKESEKDTTSDEVTKITFEPSLATFEMDLMKKLQIDEPRLPALTYWY